MSGDDEHGLLFHYVFFSFLGYMLVFSVFLCPAISHSEIAIPIHKSIYDTYHYVRANLAYI